MKAVKELVEKRRGRRELKEEGEGMNCGKEVREECEGCK